MGDVVFPSDVAPPPGMDDPPQPRQRPAPRYTVSSAAPQSDPDGAAPAPSRTVKPAAMKLKSWQVDLKAGYIFGLPTPISAETHGIALDALFKFNQHPAGYTLGANFTHTWPRFRVTATDRDSDVVGRYRSFNLVLGRETLKGGRLSLVQSNMVGVSQAGIPAQTLELRGERVDVPGAEANGFEIATRFEPSLRLTDWLTVGGTFMLGVTDAKGVEFDRMILRLGLHAKISLGPKAQDIEISKDKPTLIAFSHSLAGIALGLMQRHFMNGLNDANEKMLDTGLITGTDEPGALANVVYLKLATNVFGMLGQGTALSTFFSMEDWRSWLIAGAVGLGGAGYLFSGTSGQSAGVADLASVARMFIFKDLMSAAKRDALSDKEKEKKLRNALLISSAVNLGVSLIGAFVLASGSGEGFARAAVSGATTAQGGATFVNVPGMKSNFTAAYTPAMYYWSKDGSGWLGGAILKKTFAGTNVGVETTVATSMLNGKNIYGQMKPGEPFYGTLLPSFACAAVGYDVGGTHWSFFIGPRQCIRHGGSDLKVASIGAQASFWGKLPIGKVALVGGLSLGADWNVGKIGGAAIDNGDRNAKGANSVSLTVAPVIGLEF